MQKKKYLYYSMYFTNLSCRGVPGTIPRIAAPVGWVHPSSSSGGSRRGVHGHPYFLCTRAHISYKTPRISRRSHYIWGSRYTSALFLSGGLAAGAPGHTCQHDRCLTRGAPGHTPSREVWSWLFFLRLE